MRIASLGMYDMPPVRRANDALWHGIADRLRTAGLEGFPETLDRSRPLDAVWRDPALLLAQTCGYPLVTRLAGIVRPIATPVYRWPGCEGPFHRSVVVVAAASHHRTLADLRGTRAAINGDDSNTGMNLFRHAVVLPAGGGPFFSSVARTGSHAASLAAVAAGDADVAAIDCVTFGLLSRHEPASVARVRILCETASGPSLPFVTRAGTPQRTVTLLRDALSDAIADPLLAPATEALGLVGVETLPAEAYDVLLDYEAEAAARGYPQLR